MTVRHAQLRDVLADAKPGFASGDDLDDGVFQIRMNNLLRSGELVLDKRRRVSPKRPQMQQFLLHAGDVLFNATNSPDLVGKTAYFGGCDEPAVFSNHFIRLRSQQDLLDSRYLARWLQHEFDRGYFKAGCKQWVNQATFGRERLEAMGIPLPPIEEQRRIAAVLDAADALRTKRRHALAKLDTLIQSIFIDMFGDRALAETPIEAVAEVQGGLQVTSKRVTNPIEVPYLRVANVHRGVLDLGEVKSIRVTQLERERTRLAPGDLLVVEGHGNPNEIGRVAQWQGEVDDCVHQNHLIRVRCGPSVKPRYLESYLNSLSGRQALLRAANTTSGLNTITTSDVRGVRIPLPGLAAQQRFVLASERVDEERRKMVANQDGTERLFASLQQRAFRGDL